MIYRIFISFIVSIAVIVGICAISMPRDQLVHLIMFRDFFDVSLPILAFGALVKYLCTCCEKNCMSQCGKGKCGGCGKYNCNCNGKGGCGKENCNCANANCSSCGKENCQCAKTCAPRV